jgi:hypothetical protein
VDSFIVIFEMLNDDSLSFFKHYEKLEEIRRTNDPAKLPVKAVSVTGSLGNSTRSYNQWYHYRDINSHNEFDCKEITKFNQQRKAHFEVKANFRKNLLNLVVIYL